MGFLRATTTIWIKDLLIEFRSQQVIVATILFSLVVVLLAAFALGLNELPRNGASAGILWIAISLSGILTLTRTFIREREFGVWTALCMTPVPRSAIYLGKSLAVLTFLLIAEIVLLPIIGFFFKAPILEQLPSLAPVLILGSTGYALVGTLLASMNIRSRLRDLLLGATLYPLITPLLIFAVKATEMILDGDGLSGAGDFISLLVVSDIVFAVAGLWLFGPLVED